MAEVEQSIQQRIANVEADISEAKEQLKAATGEERVEHARSLTVLQRLAALQQQLAALEQQKLLLMQQQAGATGWAHSQGAGDPSGQFANTPRIAYWPPAVSRAWLPACYVTAPPP